MKVGQITSILLENFKKPTYALKILPFHLHRDQRRREVKVTLSHFCFSSLYLEYEDRE